MGGKVGTSGGPQADINMTPLIDIVLVVLIIMMVNIPIQVERMGLKLPSPKAPPVPPNPNAEQLVLAIYEDGKVALNRRLMNEDKVMFELQRRLRPMTSKSVFIDAHPKVGWGIAVHMVDMARAAGAVQVGLAKLKPEGPLEFVEVDPGTMPKGVFIGSPKVVGAMSAAEADRGVQAVLPLIRSCYEQRLAVQPDLQGQVIIEAIIGPNGEHMSPPSVQPGGGSLRDAELDACINLVLPRMPFEPLGAGKTARALVPVLFSPG